MMNPLVQEEEEEEADQEEMNAVRQEAEGGDQQGDESENGESNSIIADDDGGCPLLLLIDDSLSPTVVLGQDDPRRLKLTKQEYQWALDVKELIEGLPDLDDLTDYMYAQIAVITKGDLEDAVRRAFGLQDFRQEYMILDSYQEGCRYFQFLIRMFPREFLSFSFSDQDGTYVLVHDISQFDTSVLTTPERVNNFMAASYYLHTAMTPDMQTIRQGHSVLMECGNVDWTKKQDFKLMKKMFSQLLTVYPFTSESVRCYHTGMIVNLLTSMAKQVLPKEVKDSIKMGLQFVRPLNEFYMVPDAAAATQRFLLSLQETLKRRYDNERSFSLTPDST